MSVDELQWAYQYAWDSFYSEESKEFKMAKLYLDVLKKEQAPLTESLRPSNVKWGHQA